MNMVPLGAVAEFINGAAFKPLDWHEEGRRIIRIQNLNDPTKPYNRSTKCVADKYLVPHGTLLVSWSASLGVFEWKEADTALLNQHIFKVIPNKQLVDQAYLRHMLENALVDMQRYHRGSTMIHVNRKEFLGTKIPLPPLEQQRRIAGILDQADALCRFRTRALDKLNTLGHAIFHETSQAHGEVRSLKEFCEFENGDRGKDYPGKKSLLKTGVPFVSAADLDARGEVDTSKLAFISEEHFQRLRAGKFSEGDFLFCLRGSLGKFARIRHGFTGAIASSLVIIRPDQSVTPDFFHAYLGSLKVQQEIERFSNGVAQPNLSAASLKNFEIVVPELGVQEAYSKLRRELEEKFSFHAEAEKRSALLFASLQHRAFRGEL